MLPFPDVEKDSIFRKEVSSGPYKWVTVVIKWRYYMVCFVRKRCSVMI